MQKFFDEVTSHAFPSSTLELRAFSSPKPKLDSGWEVYNIEQEFLRQGVRILNEQELKTFKVTDFSKQTETALLIIEPIDPKDFKGEDSIMWRFVDNSNFDYCDSYPPQFLMPAHVTDDHVRKVLKFRSKVSV